MNSEGCKSRKIMYGFVILTPRVEYGKTIRRHFWSACTVLLTELVTLERHL